MRALVTGGTGFLGSYIVRFLADQGTEAVATHRSGSSPADGEARLHVEIVPLDVNDSDRVSGVVERANPDVVYHFAGRARVIESWEDLSGTFATNLLGTLHLLEEIRRRRPRTRFAFAGSGTEYGDPPLIPTPEGSPLRPTSPYSASKAAADLLCYQYFRSFEIPVFRYRIFGMTGPGKRGDSTNDFASQFAVLERNVFWTGNQRPPILEPRQDHGRGGPGQVRDLRPLARRVGADLSTRRGLCASPDAPTL